MAVSKINGQGCFARKPFLRRRKIGEFAGELIANTEVEKRIAAGGKVRICGIDGFWSIDANHGGNATAFINHSCRPNCFRHIARGHILFLALREISPGEEITLDYKPSFHPGRRCTCRAGDCRGKIG